MVKGRYSAEPTVAAKTVKARGDGLRVHYKNTRETAMNLKGMTYLRAKTFLENVLAHKECVPFRRHTGGPGRNPQAKKWHVSQGRWPTKSVEHLQVLLHNAAANAEMKKLDLTKLIVSHVQVNRAPVHRRRTYRAHGRITSFMSHPCHVELMLAEREIPVPKAAEKKVVVSE
uniref:60S ribosomal protein L17-2 n=1 Tax=Stygiella incarcerata TaxID=1712417 RepID=A0A192ZIF4_9EUKA|nr:60S ribosomal protein L17-2 [Stygiella incarcerata]|eukprot:TRINITY_DN2697_c0_g1_i1.p2 TRINITY_DN2697_c0_g1~~TRINITY_DN2697_c0_g1_i1.p2  ORF type:complete len:172 (+),score=40.29 TRINITY_DN2697_c0_g1_i1:118-633(+)